MAAIQLSSAVEAEYRALWEKTNALEKLLSVNEATFHASLVNVIYRLRLKRMKLADRIARTRMVR
ncbi:MAG: hypothetical protein OSB62_00760 [Alphaproteobacteria bacterium]|nr:hypothetical protein [Alphaproteobacteria bacterium]